jgi:hypothetical protein
VPFWKCLVTVPFENLSKKKSALDLSFLVAVSGIGAGKTLTVLFFGNKRANEPSAKSCR